MDHLLDQNKQDFRFSNSSRDYNSIQDILKKLISVDKFPSEISCFLKEALNKKNFKLKNLIKILNTNDEHKNYFIKFTSIGVLKIVNEETNEDIFLQLYLQIKFKEIGVYNINSINGAQNYSNLNTSSNFYTKNGIDVKIEGLFLDVTQTYMKKQIPSSSFILAVYNFFIFIEKYH